MTFEQYKDLFNQIGERPSLMRQAQDSPLVRLSKFSRENPNLYAQYRDRMRKETEQNYNKTRLPWEE